MTDYYKILDIKRTATEKEIQKAYRELAHKEHPDRGGSLDRFQQINEAFQVLSNADKRKAYDAKGMEGLLDLEEDKRDESKQQEIARLFQQTLRRQLFKMADTTLQYSCTFEDLYLGRTKTLILSHNICCLNCAVEESQQCDMCKSTRLIRKKEKITLTIPPRSRPEYAIKLQGMGDETPDAKAGDVLVILTPKKHALYEWDEKQQLLIYRRHLSLAEAIYERQFPLLLLDGKEHVLQHELLEYGYHEFDLPEYGFPVLRLQFIVDLPPLAERKCFINIYPLSTASLPSTAALSLINKA